MARWGEGDPRWIVEERPDATNVNNWHWTEKNATTWSKDRILDLFRNFEIKQNGTVCSITKVDNCVGEATANNRKGRLIYFYEWDLLLKWKGQLNKSSNFHTGTINVPNLSEENNLDDVEITITIDESNDESEELKKFMYNIGRNKIRQQLEIYIKELKEEYSKGLILPQKGAEAITVYKETLNDRQKSLFNNTRKIEINDSDIRKVGSKLDIKELVMSEDFQCSANDLYNALTKPEMLTAFTHASVKIDATHGGEFILYGGNVQGKFEELVPERKICQTWRLKNWPTGHYSNVIIELEEMRNSTRLTLKQSGIPSSEYENMRSNWYRYYWHSIKQTFGFGSALLDSF